MISLPPEGQPFPVRRPPPPLRGQQSPPLALQYPTQQLRPVRTSVSTGSMLVDSWQIIRRHWRSIASMALAGLAVAVVFTLTQTPHYRAFALLEVRPLNGAFMDIKDVDPTSPATNDPAETDVQTQIKIVESQPVTIRTMQRMKLYTKDKTSVTQSYWSGMLTSLGLAKPEPSHSATLLEDVEKSTRVRSVGPTRIIQITAESTDPFIAQLYVNTLASEYRDQTAAARELNSSATGNWLSTQLQGLQSHLEQAQANLEKFAHANSLMFLDESSASTGPSVNQQHLQEIEVDLAHAQAERMAKQAMVEQMASQNTDSLPPVLDNGPIRDYEIKLADLRRQLAELSSTLKPTHPTVIRVQNQINELTATIQREKANVLGRMMTEYQAAQRRENLLQSAYRSQVGLVSEQQAKLIRYNSLRSEVESSQALFDAMQRKVTEAHIAAALHANPIRIVNPAMRPENPVSPNWLINLLGGLGFGLVIGTCAAFVFEGADNRIRVPGEVAAQLGVRELGAIPNARTKGNLPEKEPLPILADAIRSDGRRIPNLLNDSFRSVLQSVLFVGDQGSPIGVITVSSPEPGDGKSSVVGNLAQALSELERNVLLLDCDLRRPSLHKTFGLKNERGISELLNGREAIAGDVLVKEALATRLPGVFLIPAGSIPGSIPLTLMGERMRQLIECARESYDMVIIDTPPLLQGPDARIMGRTSDGLILVIRAGKTSFTSAQGAKAILHQDDIPVLGMILNDWNPKESSYYSSYRSYYDHA